MRARLAIADKSTDNTEMPWRAIVTEKSTQTTPISATATTQTDVLQVRCLPHFQVCNSQYSAAPGGSWTSFVAIARSQRSHFAPFAIIYYDDYRQVSLLHYCSYISFIFPVGVIL